MLEPYVWYDPHQAIRQLEDKIFSLKVCRKHEINLIKDLVNKANDATNACASIKTWKFEEIFLKNYIETWKD